MNIAEEWRSRLSECERELIVHFPVRMDDGKVKFEDSLKLYPLL